MRVAIYSRKSVETDKGDSIKNQIKMCKEYFNLRNDKVSFEVFEDEGFTGANINRPSFKLMMKQLNDFDVVAVYRIDRISRNVLDFLNTFEEFKKYNVKFISITENFDTESPMGKMMLLMLSGFAQMERENIAQRVKDNMRELAKSGKWTGGTIPFGYITQRVEENNKKATYLKLDESRLQLIKEIFGKYIESESMRNVQKWLYFNGIKWSLSTIKNILTSPVYAKVNKNVVEYLKNFGDVFGTCDNIHGILSYNRRPYSNGKHRWNDKSMFFILLVNMKVLLKLIRGLKYN
ncbi:recombinase family protein [Clostridium pasteurianum]|uniref:recombinase family protein n=1 Tax=Clostridium pasteurianum TaxID=1501 RepID=UPI0003A56AC4|nr:recombinase family protein [Clostridium pasteurianum]